MAETRPKKLHSAINVGQSGLVTPKMLTPVGH